MGFEMIDMSADELEMVKLRVKTLDSNPTTTILVFQSKNTGKLRLIAEEFDYAIIDHDDSRTIYDKLKDVLTAQ